MPEVGRDGSDTIIQQALALKFDLDYLFRSTIRLWPVTGEVLLEMAGHTAIVYSVDAHKSELMRVGGLKLEELPGLESLQSGYRITSMAVSADHATFILSIPRRKMMDETQEVLRTSAFPSTCFFKHPCEGNVARAV
ncbi:hypothetical protein L1887_23894 [Cichorium endivia]|nr:hypothetical protein L1887_23894 [Cichorium endivia]